MKILKFSCSMPDDVAKEFRKRVPRGKRGVFVAEAIQAKLTEMAETEKVRELMQNLADRGKDEMPLELDIDLDSLAIMADMDDLDDEF
jgi:hypothetical protein